MRHKTWRELKLGALALAVSTLMSGCTLTPEEQALVDSVTTALPTEVAQCTFLGDVTTNSFTIPAARIDLKLQVAALGGNHLVETSINAANYPAFVHYGFRDDPFFYGTDTVFYLTGRAYFCPEGTGVKHLVPKKQTPKQLIDGPLPDTPAEQGALNQDASIVMQPQASLYIPYRTVDELIPQKPFLAQD